MSGGVCERETESTTHWVERWEEEKEKTRQRKGERERVEMRKK